jgi:hypothetical protein
MSDLDWMEYASCKATNSADLFFVSDKSVQKDVIKQFCRSCSVSEECLEYALRQPKVACYGIWGGLTEDELRRSRERGYMKSPLKR